MAIGSSAERQENGAARGSLASARKTSAALLALALFLGANVFLSGTQRTGLARASTYTKDDITVKSCLSKQASFNKMRKPDIVLMGSSLMMAPLWRVDQQRHGLAAGNTLEHSTSLHLQDLLFPPHNTLQAGTAARPGIFNFAVPGAMMSDEYLFAWKFFRHDRRPDTVVIGLAPRDFMDNMVTSECRTVPYQVLLDPLDVLTIKEDYIRTSDEFLDVLAAKSLYLYGKRSDIQRRLLYAVAGQGPKSPFQNMAEVTESDYGDARLDFIYSEIGKKEGERKSLSSRSIEDAQWAGMEIWKGCLFEYWRRYKGENKQLFARQKRFLDRFLQLCHERDIRVILVNMPLTASNKGLMPAGMYDRYLASISGAAGKFGCTLIDLDKVGFSDDQFFDPVHLNESGGKRMLEAIARKLSTDEGAIASKKMPTQ